MVIPKYIATGYCYYRSKSFYTFIMNVGGGQQEYWDVDIDKVPEGCKWGDHVRIKLGGELELYTPEYTAEEQIEIDKRVEELERLLEGIPDE